MRAPRPMHRRRRSRRRAPRSLPRVSNPTWPRRTWSATARSQSYTTITAPLSGVVIWRYADTGALIQAGTASDSQSLPLVKLSQSDLLRLRLPVPEDAVGYIHDGDTVQIRVDALHRSLTGKIVRFTRNVSLDTRTMETEVDVPNKDLSLIPGMYAEYVRAACA